MSVAEAAALAIFLAALLALALIDLRRRLLPNLLVYPAAAGALAAAPLLPADGYAAAAVGGLLAFTLFAVVYFARPGTIGAGDVKLAGLIGLALGLPQALLSLALASLVASVVVLLMVGAGRWTWRSRIAYGPYLSFGAGLVALVVAI